MLNHLMDIFSLGILFIILNELLFFHLFFFIFQFLNWFNEYLFDDVFLLIRHNIRLFFLDLFLLADNYGLSRLWGVFDMNRYNRRTTTSRGSADQIKLIIRITVVNKRTGCGNGSSRRLWNFGKTR